MTTAAVSSRGRAAVSDSTTPAQASSADLALLAAQLQALAEEMARLRLGLDRLLAVSDAACRPGPDPGGLGGLREQDPYRAATCSTAGGAEEARGRAVWVQERLLLEAQALLGEMVAGTQPQAAGVFADARLRKGPAHAKKARAAAAAAAAAAASAATGAQGDGMELAGTRRPPSDDDRARAAELEPTHRAESESAGRHHLQAPVGQPPEIGRTARMDVQGRDPLGGGLGTMAGMAASHSAAPQRIEGRHYDGPLEGRGWGGASARAGAQGDGMELAGTRRPRLDNDQAQAGGPSHRAESTNHSPEIGSGSLSCSGTGSGRDVPGRDPLGGWFGTTGWVAASDSGAPQLGAGRHYDGPGRGRGGVSAGAGHGEGGESEFGHFRVSRDFSARCTMPSAFGPGPIGVPSQQHCNPLPFSDAPPPWLGNWPAPLPAGAMPAILHTSPAAQAGQCSPAAADGWPAAAPGQAPLGSWGREIAPPHGLPPSESSGGAAMRAAAARYCI